MKREQKLMILQQAMMGNNHLLQQIKNNIPPRYTPEREAERRAYLSELLLRPCTESEFRNMFGYYDIERWESADRPILYIILPNGMKHYPAYCHGLR